MFVTQFVDLPDPYQPFSICSQSTAVVSAVDLPFVMILLGQGSPEVTSAATFLIQTLLNWYTGLEEYTAAVAKCEEDRKKGERNRWPKLEMSKLLNLPVWFDRVFCGLFGEEWEVWKVISL